jgi:hypothetical protein
MKFSVAPVTPVPGTVRVPFKYCQSRYAESGAPVANNATQSAAFPGPFATVTVAHPPGLTVDGAAVTVGVEPADVVKVKSPETARFPAASRDRTR